MSHENFTFFILKEEKNDMRDALEAIILHFTPQC